MVYQYIHSTPEFVWQENVSWTPESNLMHRLHYILRSLMICCATCSFAQVGQQEKVDSLRNVLSQVKTDTSRHWP